MAVATSSKPLADSTASTNKTAVAVATALTTSPPAVAAATALPSAPMSSAAAPNVATEPANSQPPMCATGGKRVFVCITQAARKLVEVCELATTFSYTFGKPKEKPELAFTVAKAAASGSLLDRTRSNSPSIPSSNRAVRTDERLT